MFQHFQCCCDSPFLLIALQALHKPGENPVMTVYINRERNFAFVELNTIELTTACLQLDGIKFNGQSLRIRRPNDYNPSVVPPYVRNIRPPLFRRDRPTSILLVMV